MKENDLLVTDERLRAASVQMQNPLLLDRQIARAFDAVSQWLERLEEDPELDDDPFTLHRELAGKITWDAIAALPTEDPLRPYLQRWVYRFAEWRINRSVRNQLAVLRRSVKHPVATPEAGQFSLSELFHRALRDPRASHAWLASYLEVCGDLTRLTNKLWQRRAEIAQRFGLVAPPTVVVDGTTIEQSALDWIERTQDMFYDFKRETLAELVSLALARDARAAWPTLLNWRTLVEPFRKTSLFDSFRLRSKRLPERIAPASFLRGLSRLGEEWSLALAPSDQPFVVANDPYRLQAYRDGALFAGLAHNPRFLKDQLDVARSGLVSVRRSIAISLLIESRARALKVILGVKAQQGQRELGEAFVEEAERIFGVHVPLQAAGAVWRLGEEDPQRFAGLLLAFERDAELTRAHDEDWFKNPRAVDQLRSEGALPPQTDCSTGTLTAGAEACYQALASTI